MATFGVCEGTVSKCLGSATGPASTPVNVWWFRFECQENKRRKRIILLFGTNRALPKHQLRLKSSVDLPLVSLWVGEGVQRQDDSVERRHLNGYIEREELHLLPRVHQPGREAFYDG